MKHVFLGTVTINPVGGTPFKQHGYWTYKPEYDCWYCGWDSYPADILSDFQED